MISILKISGIIGIVLSLSGLGFLKANALSHRVTKLKLIFGGLGVRSEHISYGGEEIEKALLKSFCSCDFIAVKNRRAVCCDSELSGEDKRILNEMFSRLGNGDVEAELNRIGLCKRLIEHQLKSAQEECHQKGKVYKALGVCAGLAIGIFIV